jgi:L-fuculose-phosphate aldolase
MQLDDRGVFVELRGQLLQSCRALKHTQLSHGRSGNLSVRADDGRFLISPSGMDYETVQPEQVPVMDLSGRWFGGCRPSSEWRLHRDIYKARTDVGAIVHTHSTYATALACTGRGIPAFHYMVAMAGGADIRCASYYAFGSQELADATLAALHSRKACLLANHGVVATGADLQAAFSLAAEVENLARQYCVALTLGQVRILDETQMCVVLEQFRTYGRQDAADPGRTADKVPADAATGSGP